jgi:hypothetical protein
MGGKWIACSSELLTFDEAKRAGKPTSKNVMLGLLKHLYRTYCPGRCFGKLSMTFSIL